MWAFDPRMGVRLRPIFSSDFTHFDVPDFREVIPEAFEMVEKGFVTEQDFREFTFANAARLHTRNNPDFFKDTVVEQAVADELGLKSGVVGSECLNETKRDEAFKSFKPFNRFAPFQSFYGCIRGVCSRSCGFHGHDRTDRSRFISLTIPFGFPAVQYRAVLR